MACAAGWHDLPTDLLGCVIARLPFPGDRAHICAVCRTWRSAARQHVVRQQPPWIVLPDGSFCTTGHDGDFFQRIPGLPENATCLAATDAWLAIDCTDDVFRRTPTFDNFCYATGTFVVDARPDVRHKHNYLLYNPFSNTTVPLPELDAIIGNVAETFEIRKVLMRSSSTPEDDVIAVTTNNCNYNVILCRPGKGTHVLPKFRVIDVAFLGDVLYAITSGQELLAFHLGEDEDGRPNVIRFELVIKNPMAKYYNRWRWPQDDDTSGDDDHDGYNNGGGGEDGEESDDDDDEPPNQDEKDDNGEEEEEEEEEGFFIFNKDGDGMVSDYEVGEHEDHGEEPYDAEDETSTFLYLVRSLSRELLLVRREHQSTLLSGSYTSKVEVFKADVSMGSWVPVTANGLGKGEAVFLSRSFSKSTIARGDIEEGLVYYATDHVDDVLDTKSWTIRKMTFSWPWQRKLMRKDWLTWLFPPEIVV